MSVLHFRCILDDVRRIYHRDIATFVHLEHSLINHLSEYVTSTLIVLHLLLCLPQLSLECLDLLIVFVVDSLRKRLHLKLIIHFCLCPTALGTGFEKMCRTSIHR